MDLLPKRQITERKMLRTSRNLVLTVAAAVAFTRQASAVQYFPLITEFVSDSRDLYELAGCGAGHPCPKMHERKRSVKKPTATPRTDGDDNCAAGQPCCLAGHPCPLAPPR